MEHMEDLKIVDYFIVLASQVLDSITDYILNEHL